MRFESRRRKGRGLFLFFVILIFFVSGGYYLLNSPFFEKNPPVIKVKRNIITNLKKPIKVQITDNLGLKRIRILLTDGKSILGQKSYEFKNPVKSKSLDVYFPTFRVVRSSQKLTLAIEAKDVSRWNWFKGNTKFVKTSIFVDKKPPELYPIISSYAIRKGGSALVIFKADDENIKEVYIKTNFGKKFKPIPFYKKGYYISLVAWPVWERKFSSMLVVTDKAGNKSKYLLDFYLKNKTYRISKIKLKESFLKGKITDLVRMVDEKKLSLPLDKRFKYINESLRKENEDKISSVTDKVLEDKIEEFNIDTFHPLKNAAAVASFGDHRFYYFNGKEISSSYHLGLDLASVAQADIVSSNEGKVVFAEFNGIYGNNLIIYHGLGLYSLYGHCSSIFVKEGDYVKKGEVVAKTGKSGLALGDHLHFGILVQGLEVRPDEWIDKKWIKVNIKDIIEKAKNIIDKR